MDWMLHIDVDELFYAASPAHLGGPVAHIMDETDDGAELFAEMIAVDGEVPLHYHPVFAFHYVVSGIGVTVDAGGDLLSVTALNDSSITANAVAVSISAATPVRVSVGPAAAFWVASSVGTAAAAGGAVAASRVATVAMLARAARGRAEQLLERGRAEQLLEQQKHKCVHMS